MKKLNKLKKLVLIGIDTFIITAIIYLILYIAIAWISGELNSPIDFTLLVNRIILVASLLISGTVTYIK